MKDFLSKKKDMPLSKPIERVKAWVKSLLAKEKRTPWEEKKLELWDLTARARSTRVFKLSNPTVMFTNRAARQKKGWKTLTRGAFAKFGQQFSVSYKKAQAQFPKTYQRKVTTV